MPNANYTYFNENSVGTYEANPFKAYYENLDINKEEEGPGVIHNPYWRI